MEYPAIPSSLPIGKTLLILGPCSSGPIGIPVYVENEVEAARYFGVELVKPAIEAFRAGAPYLALMKIAEPGLSKNQLYIALEEAYDLLFGFPCDLILPIGAYYDDSEDILTHGADCITFKEQNGKSMNFAYQLARFCYRKLQRGEYCHGVIGINRPPAIDTDGWFNLFAPLTINGDVNTDRKFIDNSEDIGRHISIVTSWVLFDDYITSGAAIYAGLIASLAPKDNPTYRTLPAISIDVEFSEDQLVKLSKAGFVSFRNSVRHGIVPYDAVTFAMPSSDFYYLPSVRIANEVCTRIQSILEIGTTVSLSTPAQLAESVLHAMVEEGVIKDFGIDSRWLSSTHVELYVSIDTYFHVSSINLNLRVRVGS